MDNGIKREEIEMDLLLYENTSSRIYPRKLVRAKSGKWTIYCDVSVICDLGDGRTIRFERYNVPFPAQQEGRKPNPDPFGHKKKAISQNIIANDDVTDDIPF